MDAQDDEGLGLTSAQKCEMPFVCRALARDGSDGARTRDLRRDRPAL
jgi:hypothetical protein